MKKSLTYLFIFGAILINCKLSAQTCDEVACLVVGDPYIENNCFASIERYLARSMAMDGLTASNNQTHSWPSECMNSAYACSNDYTACPLGGFCPERYCEDISLLVDLNIAYIRRAAHIWTSEHLMVEGGSYYVAAQRTVEDINRAYDCGGLRRPIIQAAILENITTDINLVEIPQFVLDAFANDVDFDASLFSGGEIFFNSCNIAKEDCIGYPDINKIETRMWYYYLATTYLDFGYKALHLGQINIIREFDEGNVKTYNLFQKIRNYAKSIGSFVIIDAHTDKDVYLEQSNTLLLDFNSFPMRPTDTHANVLGESCSGDYNIQIKGSEGIYNKSQGGMSPLGCMYEQTPYFVEIDHYEPYPGNIGQLYQEDYIIWGYDEMNYFHNLSAECKPGFVKYMYSRVREIDYNGFFQFMGRNGVGSWLLPNDKSIYRLYDNPALVDEMKRILSPSLDMEISYNFSEEKTRVDCYDVVFRDYIFEAENTDASSYLTWHIQKPDGKWDEFTPGKSRRYRPLQSGIYTVYLRQDNLALPFSKGSKTISVQIDVPTIEYDDQCNQDSNSNIQPLEEEVLENHLKELKKEPIVYPNPTSRMLNIDLKDYSNEVANIILVDMLGRVILRDRTYKNIQIFTRELPDLPSGVYNLVIEQNGLSLHYKVVIEGQF